MRTLPPHTAPTGAVCVPTVQVCSNPPNSSQVRSQTKSYATDRIHTKRYARGHNYILAFIRYMNQYSLVF